MRLGPIKVVQEWTACKRKLASSKEGAKRRARKARQRGMPMHHYKCEYCEHWHIGGGNK